MPTSLTSTSCCSLYSPGACWVTDPRGGQPVPSQLLTSVLWVLPSCPFSVSPYLPPRTMSQRPPSYRDHPCSRCSPSLPPAHCPGYSVTIASGTAVNTCQRRHSTSATCLTIMTLSPPPSQSSVLHCCCPPQSRPSSPLCSVSLFSTVHPVAATRPSLSPAQPHRCLHQHRHHHRDTSVPVHLLMEEEAGAAQS